LADSRRLRSGRAQQRLRRVNETRVLAQPLTQQVSQVGSHRLEAVWILVRAGGGDRFGGLIESLRHGGLGIAVAPAE
jgi:hypothetical protein